MIGFVIIGNDVLPEALLSALMCEMGKQEQVCAVHLAEGEDVEKQRQVTLDAIDHVERGDGVLVFVDNMAASAGYLTISIMDKAHIEVVGGVNLPMLVKAALQRDALELSELAELARDEGRKAIMWRTA